MKTLAILTTILATALASADNVYVTFNYGVAPANTTMTVWRKVQWTGWGTAWIRQAQTFESDVVCNYYFTMDTDDLAIAYTFADNDTGKVKAAAYYTAAELAAATVYNRTFDKNCVYVDAAHVSLAIAQALWRDYKSCGPEPEGAVGTVIRVR